MTRWLMSAEEDASKTMATKKYEIDCLKASGTKPQVKLKRLKVEKSTNAKDKRMAELEAENLCDDKSKINAIMGATG